MLLKCTLSPRTFGFRFCPSVFFFLLIAVPSIWFLELYEMERRIQYKERYKHYQRSRLGSRGQNETEEGLHTKIEGLNVSKYLFRYLLSKLYYQHACFSYRQMTQSHAKVSSWLVEKNHFSTSLKGRFVPKLLLTNSKKQLNIYTMLRNS